MGGACALSLSAARPGGSGLLNTDEGAAFWGRETEAKGLSCFFFNMLFFPLPSVPGLQAVFL